MIHPTLAVLVGLWLAALQISLFLSLQLLLSSAYLTFVVVILAWIVGGAIGVWVPAGRWTLPLMLVAGVSPYLSFGLLAIAPYNTSLMGLHGLLITMTALYAGHFFQQERQYYKHIGELFFWENNGFVLGLILGVLGFVFYGRPFLYAIPACGLIIVLGAFYARNAIDAGHSTGEQ